jgi:hypothetical protein
MVRIFTSLSAFYNHLDNKHISINKAQLGTEEGMSLGWMCHKHPSVSYHAVMKEQLKEVMSSAYKDVHYKISLRR